MVERAYSEELKRNISADEVWKLKNQGVLKDQHAFRCFDNECKVRLTFYGWDSPKVSHRFTIQNRDISGHHVHGCLAIGPEEEGKQRKEGLNEIENAIGVGETIVLGNTLPKTISLGLRKHDNIMPIQQENGKKSKPNKSTKRKRVQKKHVNELGNVIDMFNSPDIDNRVFLETQFRLQRKIEKKVSVLGLSGLRSLEELFFNIDNGVNPKVNFFHIFYGRAHLEHPEWAKKPNQKNIIQLIYNGNSELTILTNRVGLERILKKENRIDELLHSGEKFDLYFGGFFDENGKGKSLTQAMYRSFYIKM